jgi:metallo-beta-lactamase family protein
MLLIYNVTHNKKVSINKQGLASAKSLLNTEMKLTFYGGVRMVTGANYLLENKTGRILIDCGLQQGSRYCERQNFEPFKYDPASIKTLFVTHAHIDHIGRIPKLYKDGFRGEIYSTPPTKDLAEYLLIDSENILAHDAEEQGKEPLYHIDDINNVLSLWKTVPYHKKIKTCGFEAELYDAGHILGSSSIVISDSDGKRIVFSGDIGNSPAPIIKSPEKPEFADYVVMESTYGGRIHEDISSRKNILEDTIEDTIRRGGVLMIPAFALERTQELLFELNDLVENNRISKVPVYIDSPLAIKLTAIYKKYSKDPAYVNNEAISLHKGGDAIFDFAGLRFTLTPEQSKEINDAPSPKIIIAGAGMMQGGRIIHHEKKYLRDPKNTLLFIGYQVVGSMGRYILDGAKSVKILGEEIPVDAKVLAIGGYSAHADQPALLDWLTPARKSIKKVFLVQGEEGQMMPLAQKIEDGLAIQSEIPTLGQEVIL